MKCSKLQANLLHLTDFETEICDIIKVFYLEMPNVFIAKDFESTAYYW